MEAHGIRARTEPAICSPLRMRYLQSHEGFHGFEAYFCVTMIRLPTTTRDRGNLIYTYQDGTQTLKSRGIQTDTRRTS